VEELTSPSRVSLKAYHVLAALREFLVNGGNDEWDHLSDRLGRGHFVSALPPRPALTAGPVVSSNQLEDCHGSRFPNAGRGHRSRGR
jgi:hypothetical protein